MQHSGSLAYTPETFLSAALAEHERRGLAETAIPSEEYLYKYLRDTQAEDFAAFPLADAAGLALDLWQFAHISGHDRNIRIRPAVPIGGEKLDIVEIAGRDINFLLDSTISACTAARAEIVGILHPILEIDGQQCSLIQVVTLAMTTAGQENLLEHLQASLTDVELANADFTLMRDKMLGAAARVRTMVPRENLQADEIAESADFLDWLCRNHFIFLGVNDYAFPPEQDKAFIPKPVENAGLGILRSPDRYVLTDSNAEPTAITPGIRAFLNEPSPIIVAKSNMRSRVHRDIYADYICVKHHDQQGNVIGESRFVGLFSSEIYNLGVSDVPLIRRKVARAKAISDIGGSKHSSRALHNVMENFPRDELLQIEEQDLARISSSILGLYQRPRTRLFIRRDRFDRFVSALMFTPKEQYSGPLQVRIHEALAKAYKGRMSIAYTNLSSGPMARVHFIIGLGPGHKEPDEAMLEHMVCEMSESWETAVKTAAKRAGITIQPGDAAAFPAAYTASFDPDEAITDLQAIASMGEQDKILIRVCQRQSEPGDVFCKLYHGNKPVDLSEIVPVLENMGLRVRSESEYHLDFKDGQTIWIHDIMMATPNERELPDSFVEAFTAIWNGRTENDGFNQLVIRLGISWREAALLRAMCRYRQQTGLDPSQRVQIATLVRHEQITHLILRLFAVCFDPDDNQDKAARQSAAGHIHSQIEHALDNVQSLDQDRVLRRLSNLVSAIVRTNFYQLDQHGQPAEHIAIKIASNKLDILPAPKPYREIFVWSPVVEGIHLRFGPVARGGLRWSDRRDDFRTEILGLVKAQQVKNAVIVPVGSKGGFYPKMLPVNGSREEIMDEGIKAYKIFVSAIIELTDNIVAGTVVHPERCVILDGEDPYLVVAADKGTATFSDTANAIAAEHGFWLGDAFASGGSAGYDHKKMGITARGAWEAIKRHFREIGKDIQSESFTAIGVGDMSGDVFGNGMLLSQQTKLLAAFNHMHIFVDPDPDTAISYDERKRLFELPRSGWNDYSEELISEGGGVFSRSAKSIQLSPQIQALTGLTESEIAPDQLIAALLTARVELLWFGGVGTYIKASNEQNNDVGDKANDLIRANADNVQARIIGEGANLACTQAGRIEFATRGGRINSDAVDNSAGVSCSDHEVNIKILLSGAIEAGELPSERRNDLLAAMTDEVSALVLQDNYEQTGALSRMQFGASDVLDAHERLIFQLETRGVMNRNVEGLPSTEELQERRHAKTGLTRPELSVLIAYAKIDLANALAEGSAPDDPSFEELLSAYFPAALADLEQARRGHRLRREIISTMLANRLINAVGPVFPYQLIDAQAMDAGKLTRIMEAVRCIFDADTLFERIDALDNKIPSEAQTIMRNGIAEALCRSAMLLSTGSSDSVKTLVDTYHSGVALIRKDPDLILSPSEARRVQVIAATYQEKGAPADIAHDAAFVRAMEIALEAVNIARAGGWPLPSAARIHNSLCQLLYLDNMRIATNDLNVGGYWEKLVMQQIGRELPPQVARLCLAVMANTDKVGISSEQIDQESALMAADAWLNPYQSMADNMLSSLKTYGNTSNWSMAKLVLASGALRDFVRQLGQD